MAFTLEMRRVRPVGIHNLRIHSIKNDFGSLQTLMKRPHKIIIDHNDAARSSLNYYAASSLFLSRDINVRSFTHEAALLCFVTQEIMQLWLAKRYNDHWGFHIHTYFVALYNFRCTAQPFIDQCLMHRSVKASTKFGSLPRKPVVIPEITSRSIVTRQWTLTASSILHPRLWSFCTVVYCYYDAPVKHLTNWTQRILNRTC